MRVNYCEKLLNVILIAHHAHLHNESSKLVLIVSKKNYLVDDPIIVVIDTFEYVCEFEEELLMLLELEVKYYL